ncbi:probable phosphoribosylformylglycinamidine synthase, chloroplastic/mitochondrial [Selaginella moellendorffii]|uniref:probable phosphoribosylformylglycinamidine synthase, chloroplastic/mitochondrial n=1 Tax=Selaginella moellendorffii TaxID=88036 RepID=UPI000D1CA271|nr:probable phosphoribosylformylglycinamidine synthase, chloroplastic/mitochondrial [Selaginella moellendorffii]|eukprot:XP_024519650.1 probable phosphoribosylformylglycinamidine synthase, chloroplastic/mitochondrial [Selaginella moellendorffii]
MMYNPAVALLDTMIELEVAIEDITLIITPDLKVLKFISFHSNLITCFFQIGEEVVLLHITVGTGKGRLGGLALAQFFYQDLIGKKLISAGHNIEVTVSLLEMSLRAIVALK